MTLAPPGPWWIAFSDRPGGIKRNRYPKGLAISVLVRRGSMQLLHRIQPHRLRQDWVHGVCSSGGVGDQGSARPHQTNSRAWIQLQLQLFRTPESITTSGIRASGS
jgi:hypothetical protein